MAAEFTTKVRLVRCPKCRLLLPELPDFPVYKCGGCGAVLQAKNRPNGLRSRSSGLNGTVAAQMNGLAHGSEDEASSSSSSKTTLPDTGECSADKINEKNQSLSSEDTKSSFSTLPDSGECFLERNKERCESKSLKGIESSSSSSKATAPESRECSLERINESDESESSGGIESRSPSPKATAPESGECSLERINEGDVSKSSEGIESSSSSPKATAPELGECSLERINEGDVSKSSEGIESSSSSPKATDPESGECSLERINERDESKSSEGIESSSSSPKATAPELGECSLERINEGDVSKSSEGIESSSSSPKATDPESGECSLERINERDESKSSEGIESSSSSPKATAPELGECSLERINERDESKSSEGIESSSSSPKATAPELGECSLERINERDESKSSEGIESSSSSPKATDPESGECFSDHKNEKNQNKSSEIEDSSSLSHKAILLESGECASFQNNWSDPDKSSKEDCGAELLGDLNLPNEDQNNQIDQNDSDSVDLDIEQRGVSKEICEFASNETQESLSIAGASSEASRNDESLPLAQPNVEVDIKMEIESDSRSSSAVNAVATTGSSSINSSHMPLGESISSDILLSSPDEQSNAKIDIRSSSAVNPGATRESGVTPHLSARESSSSDTLTSSPNEQLEELQNSVLKGLDHLNSWNTYETTDFLSPRSEFSAAVRDASKSPATRSHNAYDGSVSSFDGMDDQFSSQNLHTYQDAYKAANFVRHEERYRRDKFLVKSMMNRESELKNQARTSWASRSDSNELLPPRRQGHPSRDYASVQRADQYMSRMAYLQRGSLDGYDSGSFTNQMHNEFQRNSGYQSDKSVRTEPDKMTLLRMVYELQHQVNNLNVKASRQEKHIPQYHNYEASEEELFHGLNLPRDLRRSRAGSHYTQQQSKFTRIPFSSEATASRDPIDPSYMHCYPQDRQYSAPMPLPIRCNANGLCRVHPDQSCYASSQWDSETMSDDQRHNSHGVKKYFGEKQQRAKRHFRPIAGGAPIVTCYNCLKPLQIPADFLLFKRKCHRLQCGACLKVLKFSLHKRTHIVPYGVNAIGAPPSEVVDHSYDVNAELVSCSDDYGYGYGLSYCKSGSTRGGDAGNVTPSNSPQGNSVHERNMSYGSNNPRRERREIILRRSQSQNKDKNPVERFLSANASSTMLKSKKISSEIEELPPKSSSPLHRLMGYRSPSQVIRGVGLSRSGTKSSLRN
ncbi:hypothetical protein M0R45_037687 [Rubus argutus]|uniref:Zinc-ribbon domain-containing protein n=1 Tax=Rubus argutus TaxID=59490 RepID=A0AAW1W4U8_RUBAR